MIIAQISTMIINLVLLTSIFFVFCYFRAFVINLFLVLCFSHYTLRCLARQRLEAKTALARNS